MRSDTILTMTDILLDTSGHLSVSVSAYKGFSDFFLRASDDEKKRVIVEAAQRANEDQMEVYERSKLGAS